MEPAAATNGARAESRRDAERLAQAKRHVAALKGFYIHLAVFLAVISGLAIVNVATAPPWWVQWVFLGWGIGVLAHGLAVSGRASKRIAAWEQRKIKEFLDEQ